eukprot:CAMPEP_0116878582 /NCGR_PEP_ID=MMETSP0463-20121206/10327_1 /TAXON_ID=181622 /ORGANISM="Strombidinopsis sp, Strain SopsisLIS2011" /LENGTH=70 /DNA_ID=CAMNT_0004526937 /DNA_START=919 /DNA_END=1131 /DNA_ORIENTATION=+
MVKSEIMEIKKLVQVFRVKRYDDEIDSEKKRRYSINSEEEVAMHYEDELNGTENDGEGVESSEQEVDNNI